MTYPEAAYQILKEVGRPLHHRDIYEMVVRRGLWKSKARPENVEASTYGTLIKAAQGADLRIQRIGNGPSFFVNH